MNTNILCKLLAQRIPPEQFQLHGLEVVFFDPDKNNKPCTAPNESPYDTPENRAIVSDVVANYDTLEAAYIKSQLPTYEDLRRAEYPSTDEMVIALWEKVVEGKPEVATILQAKREAVKSELFPPKSKI